MRDANHEITLLLFAQDIDVLLSRLCWVKEGDTLAVSVEDKTFHFRSQGEDTDLHITALDGDIWFDESFEHRPAAIVIRAHHREGKSKIQCVRNSTGQMA